MIAMDMDIHHTTMAACLSHIHFNAQHLSFKRCNVSVSQGRSSVLLFSGVVDSPPPAYQCVGPQVFILFYLKEQ